MTPFWKYHGLGNDFVLLDGRGGDVPAHSPDRVVALCDRHLGIGADGILTIVSGGEVAPFRMIVDNADGSRSGMCGNGLRCVARYLWDSGVVSDADSVVIAAGGGVYRCERRSADAAPDRAPGRVLVHMGRAA